MIFAIACVWLILSILHYIFECHNFILTDETEYIDINTYVHFIVFCICYVNSMFIVYLDSDITDEYN